MVKPLLSMEHVEISLERDGKLRPIVHDVTFQLYPGEIVTLTGASGCGKSLTAHAIVGLLEHGCRVTNGHIFYRKENVLNYDEKGWQTLRREEIALLIQHSLNGLDPIRTVKKQMIETLNQKKKLPRKEVKDILYSLLHEVGFDDPGHILSSYPFELSGGMRQRVLLAMMISLNPKLLIADEPTTALDALNREKVLTLLKKLQRDFGLTVLLISHDHESVNKCADRIIQMDQGGIVPACYLNYEM
ncbi:ATP-binding cassette domain-containing protein [Bacillus thermotolerans]|uniref:ATP-binding cassette domain-containing protein n=1 Tax=Bacillus thermotolerans TaxID=1221996 RepID=UPI00057DADE7|nr:ABC transporter ATP-binding protein [Bacillus thermotolerans]KKB37802.1 Peptide ABC transporter, ATP-binding protein [Bacillus thermotolerans]